MNLAIKINAPVAAVSSVYDSLGVICMLLLIAAVAVPILICVVFPARYSRTVEDYKASLKRKAVKIDKEILCNNSPRLPCVLAVVDYRARNIHILRDTGFHVEALKKAIKIPFDEIIGCEIRADSSVTGGIGRAIAGGIIAGKAGAVVGAVTAKSYITTYDVIIYRKNVESSATNIRLISQKTKTGSGEYQNAVRFADELNGVIKGILPQQEEQPTAKNTSALNGLEALEKLYELKQKGILSDEEYEEKKKQYLH